MGGFQGRINKPCDTCYSFWNIATLSILQVQGLSYDTEANFEFVTGNQVGGGFKKLSISSYPDILHTFYSVASLALTEQGNKLGIRQINPLLAISQAAFE